MEKPVAIYTDHIMNRTLCYNFAKGADSPMCHINDFKEHNRTIATYGVLRGTFELTKKVNNFFYMDHGYFNQSKREFVNNKTNVINMDGYFRIVFNSFIHNGEGDYPDDRLKKLNLDIVEQKMQVVLDKDSAKKFQSPVKGIEIMDIFGLEEGKEVGLIKKSIEEAILDGVIENTHQAAMGFLKDYKIK